MNLSCLATTKVFFASQRPGPSRKRTIVEISDDKTSSEHLKVKNRLVTDGTLLLARQSGKGASSSDCVVSKIAELTDVLGVKEVFKEVSTAELEDLLGIEDDKFSSLGSGMSSSWISLLPLMSRRASSLLLAATLTILFLFFSAFTFGSSSIP